MRAILFIVLISIYYCQGDVTRIQLGKGTGKDDPNLNYSPSAGLVALNNATKSVTLNRNPFSNVKTYMQDDARSLLYLVDVDATIGAGGLKTRVFDYSTWTNANLLNSNFNPTPKFAAIPGDLATDYGTILRLGINARKSATFVENSRTYMPLCNFFSLELALYDITNEPTVTKVASIYVYQCQVLEYIKVNGTHYFFTASSDIGTTDPNLIVFSMNSSVSAFTQVYNATPSVAVGYPNIQVLPLYISGDGTKMYAGFGSQGIIVYDITNPASPVEFAKINVIPVPVAAPGDYTSGVTGFCVRADKSNGNIGVLITYNETTSIAALTLTGNTLTMATVVTAPSPAITYYDCTIDPGTGNFLVTGPGGITEYTKGATWSKVPSFYDLGCGKLTFTAYIASTIVASHSTDVECNCNRATTSSPCPLGMLAVDPPPFVADVKNAHNAAPYITITEGLNSKPLSVTVDTKYQVALAIDKNDTTYWKACNPIKAFTGSPICLAYRGDCAFIDKFTNCIAAGASAVIVVNSQTASITVMQTPIVTYPAVMVSYADGEFIRASLNRPTYVAIGASGVYVSVVLMMVLLLLALF